MKNQKVELTQFGFKFVEQIVGKLRFYLSSDGIILCLLGKNLFDLKDPWAYYVINALKAKELYRLNQEYIISNGAISIVDSFTGRVLEGKLCNDFRM